MIGDFPNLGEVKNSIANILSLAEVRKVCRVTMDTNSEQAMHVHRLDGSIMVFKEHESGLYVYDPNFTNDCVNAYSMLSTVAAQKRMFSRREVKATDTARELDQMKMISRLYCEKPNPKLSGHTCGCSESTHYSWA